MLTHRINLQATIPTLVHSLLSNMENERVCEFEETKEYGSFDDVNALIQKSMKQLSVILEISTCSST